MDFDSEAFKSNLQRAVESNSPEAINSLSKAETVFYICGLLGVDPPEDHPSEHNGTVSRALSQDIAQVLGDYVERNGTEAFHADDVLTEAAEAAESDDEGEAEA